MKAIDYFTALMIIEMYPNDYGKYDGLLDQIISRADIEEAGLEDEFVGGFVNDH